MSIIISKSKANLCMHLPQTNVDVALEIIFSWSSPRPNLVCWNQLLWFGVSGSEF